VHSIVLPTIFDKYIHTKIKENLLILVAYITPGQIYMCHCLYLYCMHYFIARRQIRSYRMVVLCSRRLKYAYITEIDII